MGYRPYIETLEKDLGSLRKQLEGVRDTLFREYTAIEEHQGEASKLEEWEAELLEGIRDKKREIAEEEKRIRCPECGRNFASEGFRFLLREDEGGQYLACPNRLCSFKGYLEKGSPFFFDFKELVKRERDRQRTFLEKRFARIDQFI